MGLPGAGKTTFSNKLINTLIKEKKQYAKINGDEIRRANNDWDFSPEGRLRQTLRIKEQANIAKNYNVLAICDFICPTEELRKEFDADITIWINTIKEGRFEDTNTLFEPPTHYDINVTDYNFEKYIPLVLKFLRINKTEKWVITGPMRTGSTVITNFLHLCYAEKTVHTPIYHFDFELDISPPNSIIHCHANKLPFAAYDGNVILSYRDPFESAISLCIQPKIGAWHLTKKEYDQITINRFYLRPMDFLTHFIDTINWYYNLDPAILENSIIIDYENFKNNPNDSLSSILNLPKLSDKMLEYFTVKNPGSPDLWIENWEEICQLKSILQKEIDIVSNLVLTKS